jgi:hypothetical protein
MDSKIGLDLLDHGPACQQTLKGNSQKKRKWSP